MKAPAEAIPMPIRISKISLIQFGKYRKQFQMEDILNRYVEIYKIKNGFSNGDYAIIKKQIETNLNILIREKVFKKNGQYITMNNK